METKNREKLLLIATGACIALWLLNLLVITPMVDSWHNRSDEIGKLKREIADGGRLAQRASVVQGRWNFMRANALNSNPTVAERQLFTAFDRWVKSGGVTQGSFRPQFQDSDSNYTTVDCRSDVNGSIRNVSDFLKAMSKDPLANKMDSFVLTTKDDNGRQLTLDLSLSGLVLTDSVPSLPPGVADATPPASHTISDTNTDLDPFQLITRNNIFDQSRFPNETERPPAVRAARVEAFSYSGPGVDNGSGAASFVGSGASSSRLYNVGDTINGFKIAKITFNDVTLIDASGKSYVVRVDTGLRRSDNGPWRPSAEVAATAEADTISTTSTAPSSSSGSSMDAVLARLKKQREEAK